MRFVLFLVSGDESDFWPGSSSSFLCSSTPFAGKRGFTRLGQSYAKGGRQRWGFGCCCCCKEEWKGFGTWARKKEKPRSYFFSGFFLLGPAPNAVMLLRLLSSIPTVHLRGVLSSKCPLGWNGARRLFASDSKPPKIEIPKEKLTWQFSRSSGHGLALSNVFLESNFPLLSFSLLTRALFVCLFWEKNFQADRM
jgi:hypothetical protein